MLFMRFKKVFEISVFAFFIFVFFGCTSTYLLSIPHESSEDGATSQEGSSTTIDAVIVEEHGNLSEENDSHNDNENIFDLEKASLDAEEFIRISNGECSERIFEENVSWFQCDQGETAKHEVTAVKQHPEMKGQNFLDLALEYYETSQDLWAEGNLDDAIEALDRSYEHILKVEPDGNHELNQQVEDLRFMISKRILEIYASRYTAVNGNHKEIPLVMNSHVEKEIKFFQGPERQFFLDSYHRSGLYRKNIIAKLKEAGLPEELSWLPLIESGFKVRALSRARALGLWQFIPSTGYKFGLERNAWIDERLDPDKATDAAIAYMTELHQIFGDWTTVLAAYNCGEGAVLRVLRNQKINYLDHFWDLYHYLPYETARYVPRFLATLHIIKDPEKYGFELDNLEDPLSFEVVTVEKQVHLSRVAQALNVSERAVTDLNPELRYKATPASPYELKVPVGEADQLSAKIDDIPTWKPPQRRYVYHRVRRGETLSRIAVKYRTSVRAIMRANHLRSSHFIRAGKKLKIPVKGYGRTGTVASAKLGSDGTYRVRKGDSLWRIAKKFNTTAESIKQINNLQTSLLHVGQVLVIKKL